MSIEEAIARMEAAEQERRAKREEMERLTRDLLTYDSESLGDAIKCYLSQEERRDRKAAHPPPISAAHC